MRALLNSAVEAFYRGIDRQPTKTALFNGAEEAGKALLVLPLDASDRAALGSVSGHRERALSLARSGDLDEATTAMNAARLLISLAHFSANAEPVARTAHYAAVSYLSYRRGDYDRARQEMEEALRQTDRISQLTGDNALLSARRVHLVHNIMKVDLASGTIPQVPRTGFAMLRFLAEGPSGWPLEFGPGPETRPDPPVAEYQSNKIVETVAEAAWPVSDRERRACWAETKRLVGCPQPPSGRAWAWLSLRRWQLERQSEEFLTEAASFLEAGPETTPKLWYAVALDVLEFCQDHQPDEAPRAMEAMATTIATSPFAPDFVRARVIQQVQVLQS